MRSLNAAVFILALFSVVRADDPLPPHDAKRLIEKYDQGRCPLWSEGNKLVACFVGPAKEVSFEIGGLTRKLQRVQGTDLWTWSADFPNLESGVLSYAIYVSNEGANTKPIRGNWRGPKAPPTFQMDPKAKRNISTHSIPSKNLKVDRKVSVYQPSPPRSTKLQNPVIYSADGENLEDYVDVIETLLLAEKIPPITIVGVHANGYDGGRPSNLAEYDAAKDWRQVEYLPIIDNERFQRHAKFFVDEVRLWAEEKFDVSRKREERAVFGRSNGGRFAATIGVEHPDVFGTVIAFSLAVGEAPAEIPPMPFKSNFYFAAGEWETTFLKNTKSFHEALLEKHLHSRFAQRVSGHDAIMWQEEFASAIVSAFGKNTQGKN